MRANGSSSPTYHCHKLFLTMKNIIMLLLIAIPFFVLSQKNSWRISLGSGTNISFNRMTAIVGDDTFLNHKKPIGGYWEINGAYQFAKRTAFTFGVDHVAYKFSYKYGKFRGPSTAAQTQIYVWGFPLGLETNWFVDHKFAFTTGYGLKYRINNFGYAIPRDRAVNDVDENGVVIEQFRHRDYNYQQNDHMIALFLSTQFIYKVKPFLNLGIKLTYNQGLNIHESFILETSYIYPQENRREDNIFSYESRVSYFSAGFTMQYIFTKQKKNEQE